AQGTLPGFISALRAGLRPIALRNVLRAQSFVTIFLPVSQVLRVYQKSFSLGSSDEINMCRFASEIFADEEETCGNTLCISNFSDKVQRKIPV
ncbi:MAG: hypothetical protein ACI3XU_00470, partial [Butyricicoccaceae bacterium]